MLLDGKVFFSEEKKQKTFAIWRVRQPNRTHHIAKVFWFFFSKKTLSFLFLP
jgi:hypothetical protein